MDPADLNGLRIVYYPHPALRERCAPVEDFGPEVQALADRMFELMREGSGVGLAGPQVGLPIRIFVCNPTGEPGDDLVCINPEFLELDGAAEAEEGCLSLPGVSVHMRRATKVVMEAFDANGKPFRRTGENLSARIWQHESDHLDGRLIIDAMSATDEIANRRAIKQLKEDYGAVRRR